MWGHASELTGTGTLPPAGDWATTSWPFSRPDSVAGPAGSALVPCPEIECLRHLLPAATLAAAQLRAAETGTGADRVLVTDGILTDAAYARALAAHHGLAFEPLDGIPRRACPLCDTALLQGLATGLIPLTLHGERIYVIAPWHLSARLLCQTLHHSPDVSARIRITTAQCLRAFMHREAADVVACRAAFSLRAQRPDLSAASLHARTPLSVFAAGMAICVALSALQTGLTVALEILLALIFLGWSGLRVLAILLSTETGPSIRLRRVKNLPIYSLIVAVYDEAESVPALIDALMRLDYPKERMDIKIVVEADDLRTRMALDLMRLPAPFDVLIAPAAGPRTKPKALNAALPFVRGRYVAVFDAEDRPEPAQLRIALAAFDAAGPDLACVQARLTIDNTADSWLTRLFTAEYAGLFDVFLPGLAAFRMPLPLGGTSNHFHTATLISLGGWDPYNVTEDADLGIRLSRAGYRTAMIAASTYEEAPSDFAAWLRQRTRWFKGYLQTWAVHMRNPLSLWSDLGPSGFIVFQLVVGGAVLAALVHGVFAALIAWHVASGMMWQEKSGILDTTFAGLYITTLVSGYLMSGLLGFIGLSRRRLLTSAPWLILIPFYWVLLSIAAWRAVIQILISPYRWEKTAHGLARTSRRAPA